MPDALPDGRPWPCISLVTPSYNQADFLEETIRSVLLQGYPEIEYSIVDGGSTDRTLEIIHKYERWLAEWVSEPDRGQSDAVNRGLSRSSGDVLGWVNSDDVYESGAFEVVGSYLAVQQQCALIYGNGWYIDANSCKLRRCSWVRPFDRQRLLTFNFILQPAAFWRRALWQQVGGLHVAYQWGMDWDWFLRATARQRPCYLPVDLARWRIRPGIKTLSGGHARSAELAAISRQYGGRLQPTYLLYQLDRLGRRTSARAGSAALSRSIERVFAFTSWLLRATVWRDRSVL